MDAPALEIDVSSLIWIDGQRLVDHIRNHKEGKPRFRRDEPQETSETLIAPIEYQSTETRGNAPEAALELVAKYLPTAPHQTDANHWALSGELLAQSIELSAAAALAIGRHYFDLSNPNF